jgi:tetratricopeptide (TPR) repeat protein
MMRNRSRLITFLLALLSITSYELLVTSYESFAQDGLEQLKEKYFQEHQYSGFVDYLKNSRDENPAQASYYIALSRYEQLGYLEETQSWEEYFDRGEEYRQEFMQEALNALDLASDEQGPLFIYANCLLWQYHKDMRDDQEQAALGDLLAAVRQYSEAAGIDLSAIKYVADKLSAYADRINSQRVYSMYLEGLGASLEEGGELKLISLARELAGRDDGIGNPFFAEEAFKKLEELNPGFVVGEQDQYLRARNLEKIKQYKDASVQYQVLIENYPDTPHYAEAVFKIGVISAYILQDTAAAVDCLSRLAEGFSSQPQALSSLYQLGLISQYQDDIAKASEYYNALLSLEGAQQPDLIKKAADRLKEIEEGRGLEFNLKTFMEAVYREDRGIALGSDVDIKLQCFKVGVNQDIRISALALPAASGCMPVNLEYLWSGDLGSALPGSDESSFITQYSSAGTKLIQVTAVTPAGILDCNFVFLEVEGQDKSS